MSYTYDSKGYMTSAKEYLEFSSQADKAGATVEKKISYNSYTGMPSVIEYVNGTEVQERYEVSYDKLGYITGEKISSTFDGKTKSLNNTYEYDAIGRLTKDTLSVTKDGSTESKSTVYTYDDIGNRLTMNQGSDSYTFTYSQIGLIM